MHKLTIFIPTYNRELKVIKTLEALVNQIKDDVLIIVLDNYSDIEIEKYCINKSIDIEKMTNQGKIIFSRNKYNIGMSANFMRAFELCNSEWMWLISDDDDISLSAIAEIIKTIDFLKNNKQVSFVKFSSSSCKNSEMDEYITDIESFINILAISKDWFNSFIFLTNGLYRVEQFKQEIQIGYQNLHTYVPHFIMLLNCIYKNKHSIYMSNVQVVNYVPPEVGYSYGLVAGLGVGAFKNFTFNLKKESYLKLESIFAAHNDFKVTVDIFYQAKYNTNLFVAKRLINNYYDLIKNSRGLTYRSLYRLFNMLVNFPNFFEFFIGLLAKLNPSINKHIKEIIIRYKN